MDSLLKVLEESKEDTNKVKVLYQFCYSYVNSDPEKLFKYSKEMLALAQKLDFKEYVFKGYQMISIYYHYTGDSKLALENLKKAIPIVEQMNDSVSLSDLYGNMGIFTRRLKDYYGAFDYTKRSLEIAKAINDSSRIAHGLQGMGVHYQNLASDYPTALGYFFQALKICEATSDSEMTVLILSAIGHVYALEKNYDKAIEYCLKGLKLADETNDQVQFGKTSNDIGLNYYYKKDFNKALEYLNKALTVNEKIGNAADVSDSYDYLANVFLEMNNVDKALEFEFKSFHLSEQLGDHYLIGNYSTFGAIYMKKKEYIKANNYLFKCLILAKKTEDKGQERDAYKALSQNYKLMNDFKSAYINLIQYMQVNDSITYEEARKKTAVLTAELEVKYNTEKKEKEISLLTKDKEIQNIAIKKQTLLKNSFIGGLVLALILFFFIYSNYRTRQKLKLETIRNNIAADLHDDIGSTLNSISLFSEVAKQEAGKSIPALDQIGVSARKIIDAMSDIVWTINPENDTFENVISRMRSLAYLTLKAKGIEFVFKADESLNQLSLPMLVRKNIYLLFKEATNNIVKYSNASRASFHLSLDGKNAKMSILDNGVGFDIENAQMGNGIKNMKRRAAEIGTQLLIESSQGKGTNIEISFKA